MRSLYKLTASLIKKPFSRLVNHFFIKFEAQTAENQQFYIRYPIICVCFLVAGAKEVVSIKPIRTLLIEKYDRDVVS